jgi:hypothetical protein
MTPELAAWLPAECRDHADLIHGLQLSANARFQATNQNAVDGWYQFSVEGQVAGRIEDNRLPFPITDLEAKFSSDGRSLRVYDVSGRAGSAALTGSCEIAGFREDAPCRLDLNAQRLAVDRQLVGALPHEWREIWGKLAPEGIADVSVSLEFDGKTIKHSALVDCREVSFAYHKFPYRLSGGKGRV